jgi:iron complex outermembrane receptor protein
MGEYRIMSARHFCIGVATFALASGIAHAQEQAARTEPAGLPIQTAPSDQSVEDIVVTGSLIRGVAPVGSQEIGVAQKDIAATGASNTSQLLASLPQTGVFNTVPAVQGLQATQLTVNRPTLRNLGNTSSGSASTLILVDGHRLPGMGVRQTSPDVDAIAPGIIERVEIVTDGGSSTYGSDAVGGVINFITKKRFDGVEASARYGLGDDYRVFDADLTVGTAWQTGSAYLSYNYEYHDAIFGSDRDFVRRRDYVNNVAQDALCAPGNVVVSGTTYALPGLTSGLGNRCDNGDFRTVFPTQKRHSVFAGLILDDGGPVNASVKGYYFHRENVSDGGPLTASITLNRLTANGLPNPYYLSTINGQPQTATETFQLSLAPVLGNSNIQKTRTESYGFTPTMSADIGRSFQFNAFANYGVGISEFNGRIINPATFPTAAAFGAIDPSNLTGALSSAVIGTAADYYDYGRAKSTLVNSRAVIDGPLFALGGGDVRIAAGVEYTYEQYAARIQQTTAAGLAGIPTQKVSRTIEALFGEINVPLLGEGSGIHALTLTASGRYDDYSDVGHTFNPKLGLNFLPVRWLTLRGNWGKSFQAPSLADSSAVSPPVLINLGNVRFPKPGVAGAAGQTQIFLNGVVDPLRPQTARTYSFGFDVKPPFVDGLTIGGTYYRIKFKDQIAVLPIFDPNAYAQFPDLIFVAPTQAQVNALAALATNPSVLTSVPLANLYSIGDGRRRNLSTVDTQGLDFYLRYRQQTGFGAVYFNTSGNYILKFKTQANPNAPVLSREDFDTRFRISGTLGAEAGSLRGEVTWNHSGGFDVVPTAANANQAKVKPYDVIDLFVRYALDGTGILKDFAVTFNVDNILDNDPPIYRGTFNSGDGYANGFTLGRVIKLGVSKKF